MRKAKYSSSQYCSFDQQQSHSQYLGIFSTRADIFENGGDHGM